MTVSGDYPDLGVTLDAGVASDPRQTARPQPFPMSRQGRRMALEGAAELGPARPRGDLQGMDEPQLFKRQFHARPFGS